MSVRDRVLMPNMHIIRTKTYRYHRKLVKALAEKQGLDSFRFGFAHAKYNQPGWVWHMAKIQRDVDEIRAAVLYLEEKLGYKVDISMFALISLTWLLSV